jgi:uncharacterized membrane protein YedE/YeeE
MAAGGSTIDAPPAEPEGVTMIIAWNAFTPGTALAGGVLIGAAAAMLLWLNGRVAGISGIVGGLGPVNAIGGHA